jgi:RNA 3'-terminal phosphate cyclase (ATP)
MAETSALIVVDGSQGEGGGALLRTALVMSAMTQQAVRIDSVRGATRHPGLDSEDLLLITALERSCRADLVGAEVGSQVVTFLPRARPRALNADLGNESRDKSRAANALIVLNALLPLLARSGAYSTLTAEGETYGFNALSYDYFANVTLEALKKLGIYAIPDLLRPGFGRDSDGEVRLDVEPSAISGLQWTERGSLRAVRGIVATSGLSQTVSDRGMSHLKNLGSASGLPLDLEHVDHPGRQPGAFITVWAQYERGFGGGTAMGARGVKVETLAQTAFDQLLRWMSTNSTVDEFLADQLLLPLVFAEGPSSISVPRLTQRLLTAIWVVKQFTPIHITVRGVESGPGTIAIAR